MTADRKHTTQPEAGAAIAELQGIIREPYPSALFAVRRGIDDPEAIQLWTTVDMEDTEQILDHVLDRVLELQLEGLPVHVIPVRPRERVLAMRQEERARAGRQGTDRGPRFG